MKINNKTFVVFILFLAIISGIIWGMPFTKPHQGHIYTRAIENSVAFFILHNGPFAKADLLNYHIERIFYPTFLAGAYKIFGPNLMVDIVLNILVFAGLTLLVYKLCQMVFNERLARLASFIVAICYTLASYVGWLSREIFFVFFVFLLIYLLYQAQIKIRNKSIWLIMAGMAFGAACLTNAAIQYFVVFIILNFWFINRKKGFKKIFSQIVIFMLAFMVFVSPWIVTGYLNYGQTPFFCKQGFLFDMKVEKMKASNEKYIQHLIANTTGDFIAQKLFTDYNRSEARLGWESIDEWMQLVRNGDPNIVNVDETLTKNSLIEFAKHPIMFLKMTSLDFLKFNTPMVPDIRMQHMFAEPDSYFGLSDFAKITIILIIRLVYLLFAILIVYASLKNIKDWAKMGWIILIAVYFNLVFSNVHAIARYSVPVYPFYIILLAMGILILWDKIIGIGEKIDNNYE